MVFGVFIVSSLLYFSFTLTKLNIAYRHYMDGQVALGGFEVIGVGELIEYSGITPLKLAGKVLARTNSCSTVMQIQLKEASITIPS